MSTPESTAAMPPMMYGTAWKKERTADLVYEAIKAGFRGIDTAAMKKHYDEAGTGEGIRRAIREGIVSRKDLFVSRPLTHTKLQIQTKFTPTTQPPYPQPPQSPPKSTPPSPETYLDAYLLHSPFPTIPQTLEAWHTLTSYLPSSPDPSRRGKILRLGISNVTLPVLQVLQQAVGRRVGPVVVQNRFRLAEREWDREVRAWVAERNRVGRR
ncbi:hypothetical protein N0V88_000510 [Collariella sp. IMI 366227]|nr:hypothetical protein N0V88_000510 [Collariella sp. IMI 366227]